MNTKLTKNISNKSTTINNNSTENQQTIIKQINSNQQTFNKPTATINKNQHKIDTKSYKQLTKINET